MNEDFLHYVWKFQKVNTQELSTNASKPLQVLKVGQHNHNAGPDFFNGQVVIGKQKWAGTIEIHLKSSDWYAHKHEVDIAYDTVILHVVWEHDAEIYRRNGTKIPTLVLKPYVSAEILDNYRALFSKKIKWIVCEDHFPDVSKFILINWLERLYIERLEQKSERISVRLNALKNHWEAVFFEMLGRSFGLHVNGASFLSITQSIPFVIIQKYRYDPESLEALLLGQAGFFRDEAKDTYQLAQEKAYEYLVQKHNLKLNTVAKPKYFRLRPHNFPTIRLSQLASLYSQRPHLFSQLMEASSVLDIYAIFNISALPYWESHYSFGVPASFNKRVLSNSFIDLLVINTIIPMRFCYAKYNQKENIEELLSMSHSLAKENNSVIKHFNALRKTATNAFESQALLQLKNEYCDKLQCMRCAIGNEILSRKH
ncbi:MAG: hypothetical protein ACI849_001615 [Patiriisocius sp.]|jgi:hypothetical protein